ncbi:MAG: hypothetical protein ABFE13_23025 [Phycisphaerales bacterium]
MNERPTQISKLIVSYLGKHPDAQDTLEGIATWWLTAEQIEISTTTVADVLEDLVRQGVVTVRMSKSGVLLYNLNRSN